MRAAAMRETAPMTAAVAAIQVPVLVHLTPAPLVALIQAALRGKQQLSPAIAKRVNGYSISKPLV